MRMRVKMIDRGGRKKGGVVEAPVRERLTHVPALLNELFDYPRSTARMLICLGNVSLNGEKLTVADLDIPNERLLGGTIHCCQHTAILSASRPDVVMESSRMDPDTEAAGL